jgi:hypothetical protein
VDRSIAEGPRATSDPAWRAAGRTDHRWRVALGLALAGLALLVYVVSNPTRYNFYAHFTWQASAWLEGDAGIRYPVCSPFHPSSECREYAEHNAPYNDYYRDLLPLYDEQGSLTGRALIPFPPLPAVILLPFVMAWGLETDAQLLAAVIAGIDVALVWWMLGALPVRTALRAAVTAFFAFGTVFWYTAMIGTTWYFAHVVAVAFTVLAIGLALRRDPAAADAAVAGASGASVPDVPPFPRVRELIPARIGDLVAALDRRQFLAGLALGLACTARLPVLFGFPFLMLVGGRSLTARTLSAGLGTAIPLAALVAYNVLTTGQIFHPAYEYLYQLEAHGYPHLNYNPEWAIEDVRYIPQNLALMLGGLPTILPECAPGTTRGLFDEDCPFVIPRDVGTSLLVTSPAYLLALPALRAFPRDRVVAGAAVAVLAIAILNLMHFSQGWVQFGYRFSNDFAPFALVRGDRGIRDVPARPLHAPPRSRVLGHR